MRYRKTVTNLVVLATLFAGTSEVQAVAAARQGLRIETPRQGDVGQRRSGSVRPPTSGLYTFSVTGDAASLWVDGVKLIEDWGDTSVPRHGRLMLAGGVDLDLLLEVRAPSSGSNVGLSWEGPGVSRQRISDAALTPSRGRQAGLPMDAPLKDIARARGLLIGAAVQAEPLQTNAQYRALSAEQFSLAPAEADFVFNAQDPQDRNNFPTEGIDAILDITEAAGQESQAFHLLWPEFVSINPWIGTLSQAEQKDFAEKRIKTLMTKYRGRITTFNVTNELFDDEGNQYGQRGLTYYSPPKPNWMAYSATANEDAFKLARATAPEAALFYNDNKIENDGPKWDGVLAMVRDFKARGIPIDGVGFQAHLSINTPLRDDELRKHFRQLAELGVRVRVTELDVAMNGSGTEAERLSKQAEYYWKVTTACLSAPNCDAINLWGVTDEFSWLNFPETGLGPDAKPMIFDANYEAKPAYWAMNAALRGAE